MSKQKRKRYSPEDKVRILRLHLLEKKPISEVCAEHGIAPSQFYTWQNQFFEKGSAAFAPVGNKRGIDAQKARIEQLEAKLAKKNEVLSEAVEALIEAKKLSGDR